MSQVSDTLRLYDTTLYDTLVLDATVTEQVADTTATVVVAEQSISKEPGAWAPIMIPTVCSIIVFVLGWVVTRLYKYKDERNEKESYRNMVLDWIDLVLPIEEESVNALKSLADSISHSDDMQPVPYVMPQGIPDRLNELSLEKITDAFTAVKSNDTKTRNIHLFNMVCGLEYYSKVNAEVIKAYKSYNQQMTALCAEWNSTYMPFINNLNVSSNLLKYQPTVIIWQTELLKKKDSISVHLKYVEQLSNIADQLKDNSLMPYLNQMRVIQRQLQATGGGFATNFKNTANMLNISMQSMQQAAEYFRN